MVYSSIQSKTDFVKIEICSKSFIEIYIVVESH